MIKNMPDTPELDKMRKARDELHTQSIGHFLEWLGEEGIVLARWNKKGKRLNRVNESIQLLLAKYTNVDLHKVEEERQMLIDLI